MKALALLCDWVAPDLSEISGMFANCRVSDKVLVGISALREVYVLAKAKAKG